MAELSVASTSEKYLLPLLPLAGIALVTTNQMGRYSFYSVPFDFLEIDTVKTLISVFSLGLFSVAGLYSLLLLHYRDDIKTARSRFLFHLGAASFITMPFWVESLSLRGKPSLPTIAFILFAAAVTYFADTHVLKAKSTDLSTHDRLSSGLGVMFWVTILVLFSTFTHGYIREKELRTRLFVSGTNLIFVGKAGGQFVLKEYNPATKRIDKARTIVLQPSERTTLIERSAVILSD